MGLGYEFLAAKNWRFSHYASVFRVRTQKQQFIKLCSPQLWQALLLYVLEKLTGSGQVLQHYFHLISLDCYKRRHTVFKKNLILNLWFFLDFHSIFSFFKKKLMETQINIEVPVTLASYTADRPQAMASQSSCSSRELHSLLTTHFFHQNWFFMSCHGLKETASKHETSLGKKFLLQK